MTNTDVVNTLVKLAQLDIDAIHAYEQALKNIEDSVIYDALTEFQRDHKRHVRELSVEIQKLGEIPPEDKDFKGFLIEGFTAVRSLTGTKGALKAMQGNEELTTKTYREALQNELPIGIRTLIEKNFADEQRHLNYIQHALQKQAA